MARVPEINNTVSFPPCSRKTEEIRQRIERTFAKATQYPSSDPAALSVEVAAIRESLAKLFEDNHN